MHTSELVADAALAYRASRYAFGSLWWVSEAVWRETQIAVGDVFVSTKDSHPATIVGSPLGQTLRIYVHSGRTSRNPMEEDGIIVEMKPGKLPTRYTKFAGKRAFIGQIHAECLLRWEDDDYTNRPAGECWLHRNHPLPNLVLEDQEDLQAWVDQIFSSTTLSRQTPEYGPTS